MRQLFARVAEVIEKDPMRALVVVVEVLRSDAILGGGTHGVQPTIELGEAISIEGTGTGMMCDGVADRGRQGWL